MRELTNHLRPFAKQMDARFSEAVQAALARERPFQRKLALGMWNDVRVDWTLQPCSPQLLTPASANTKLNKSTIYTTGLTLQHYVQRVNPGLVINACPFAGDCAKVCVLDNGKGMLYKVQLARRARTAFLAEQPLAFAYLLGFELGQVAVKHDFVLFRPNVNSDVGWEQLLPSMVNGTYLSNVMLYGYSKRPELLSTEDGWLGDRYRVAYSWNEDADIRVVSRFLRAGGNVAVVTNRRKGAPVSGITLGGSHWPARRVVDADLSDEWILDSGRIGDLSAKGRARKLIGRSGFVVSRKECA